MSNVIMALNILNALLVFGDYSMVYARKISDMINTAMQEGRDLNEDEMAQIWADRDDAMARWAEAKASRGL